MYKSGSGICIDNQEVTMKMEARNLGIIIDSSLSMSSQASHAAKMANFYLHEIRKIRNFLTVESCKILIQSLVISRLDYCNALYNGANENVIHKLSRVQRYAARVIAKFYKNDHTSITELLYSLHWLPVRARIQFKICSLMFSVIHYMSPYNLYCIIKPKQFLRNTRASSKGYLASVPPAGNVRYSDRSFAVAGPVLWNALPDDIRSVKCVTSFKVKLKTFLFKKYYG